MKEYAELIDSISKLIAALIWPTILFYILIKQRKHLSSFLENLSEFSFKGPGIEASIRRKQVEATAALVAATVVARSESGAPSEITANDVRVAANAVEAVTPRTLIRASKTKIIWVDDRPNNNIRERQALEAIGIDFVISTSTEDAISKIKDQKFDVIISDIARPNDSKAGYTLLEKIRNSGNMTPVIFYTGSRASEHVAESRRYGAMGCTNRPDELFDYVISAISQK